MTRKQKRLSLIAGGLAFLMAAVLLVMFAFSQSVAYFYVPSDLAKANVQPETRIRLGGLVKEGSWKRGQGMHEIFEVTDTLSTISVAYTGILPDLFREGQGVVAEGRLSGTPPVFDADSVLAKHDETYMPKDVADRLKAKGRGNERQGDHQVIIELGHFAVGAGARNSIAAGAGSHCRHDPWQRYEIDGDRLDRRAGDIAACGHVIWGADLGLCHVGFLV
jgi:cytochrome c-type biogenesis protein CcmE